MTLDARVCVVGAGAIGLASALALARRGAGPVTVLEAHHVAAGSSGLSVGIVETQYVRPLDIELRVRAAATFAELERRHGLRIVRNGYLRLAHDERALAAFERSVEVQRSLGVPDARVLDRAGVAALVPDMAVGDVAGGLHGPSDGFLDGHLYCTLLAELAGAAGVRILAGRALVGGEPRAGGGWRVRTAAGGGGVVGGAAAGVVGAGGAGVVGGAAAGAGVVSGAVGAGGAGVVGGAGAARRTGPAGEGGGEVECEWVVDAAGPWAGRVAALLGCAVPLAPQRHQAVVVHLPRALPYTVPSVMDYTPGAGTVGLYFRHERPGQLIAGLHTEEATAAVADPDRYARGADPEFLEAVAERLAARLPTLAAARLAHGWAGLYPVSPDGLPLLGPVPDSPGLVLAAGAGGSGIQLSPVLGELVADWILEGEPRVLAGARALLPGRASLQS